MDDAELAELVSRVGCLYTRNGLSPPSQLRSAAKCWLGLSQGEIVAAVQAHFEQHRPLLRERIGRPTVQPGRGGRQEGMASEAPSPSPYRG